METVEEEAKRRFQWAWPPGWCLSLIVAIGTLLIAGSAALFFSGFFSP